MNKFLKLIEQSLPDKDKQLKYTVLEKIAKILTKALRLSPVLVISAEYPDKLVIDIEGDKLVFVLTDIIDSNGDGEIVPDEDAEDLTFKVDKEVEKLAAKASSGAAGLFGKLIGTGPQKAKAAVKRRETQALPPAIELFNQDTNDLIKAVQTAKANKNKKINVI
jgi:hypothetical protein